MKQTEQGPEHTVCNGEPPRAGGSEDVNSVFCFHAECSEASTDLESELLILAEADVVVAAQLIVLPLLVLGCFLSVDNLLDLLDLLVHLDEFPVSQRLCVAELLRAAAQDVVYCADIVGWLEDQFIFGCGMPARDCFSFLLLVTRCLDGEGSLLVRLWLWDHRLEVGSVHDVAHVGETWKTIKGHAMGLELVGCQVPEQVREVCVQSIYLVRLVQEEMLHILRTGQPE